MSTSGVSQRRDGRGTGYEEPASIVDAVERYFLYLLPGEDKNKTAFPTRNNVTAGPLTCLIISPRTWSAVTQRDLTGDSRPWSAEISILHIYGFW